MKTKQQKKNWQHNNSNCSVIFRAIRSFQLGFFFTIKVNVWEKQKKKKCRKKKQTNFIFPFRSIFVLFFFRFLSFRLSFAPFFSVVFWIFLHIYSSFFPPCSISSFRAILGITNATKDSWYAVSVACNLLQWYRID